MAAVSEENPRSRLVTWADPEIYLEAVRSGRYRSGLDLLRAMREGELPRPPIAELVDYWPAEIEEGRAVFECVPKEIHYNPMGVAHGGLAATLCDTAMACAIHSRLPLDVHYTTLELKINYVRPMTVETGLVRCTGELVHLGRRVATAESRIVDAEGVLLAHGTTTCLVLR